MSAEVVPLALLLSGTKAVFPVLLQNVRAIGPYFVLWHKIFWKQETDPGTAFIGVVCLADLVQSQRWRIFQVDKSSLEHRPPGAPAGFSGDSRLRRFLLKPLLA
jgi:hypothetical protein